MIWGINVRNEFLIKLLQEFDIITLKRLDFNPTGSPFTKMAKVIVAAARKWKLHIPSYTKELYELDLELIPLQPWGLNSIYLNLSSTWCVNYIIFTKNYSTKLFISMSLYHITRYISFFFPFFFISFSVIIVKFIVQIILFIHYSLE